MIRLVLCLLAAATAALSAPREAIVAAYVVPGAPASVLIEKFGADIAPLSQGSLTTKLLIYGEAGSEEQVMAALRRGRVHVASLGNAPLATVVPEMGLINIPFLTDSHEEFDYIFDNYLRGALTDLLKVHDMIALHWIELGPSHIYSKFPIVAVEDIKGVAIRTTFDIGTKSFLTAVGADVISLPTPDVLPALQTGMISGATSVAIAYVGTGLMEQAPHYTLTYQQFTGTFVVVERKWFEGLPPEAKAAIERAMPTTADIRRFFSDLAAQEMAKATTLTVHRPNQQQLAGWAAAARKSHPEILQAIGGNGEEMYRRIQDLRAKYAAENGG